MELGGWLARDTVRSAAPVPLLEGIAVVAFDRETGTVAPELPPPGTGLRWEEFVATMADAYQSRFGDL